MSVLLALSRAIDAANNIIGKSVSWLILVAVLISAINAVSRKLFNVSSNAWLEAQWYLFSAVFLIAAGYTLLHSEHVKVDLLYSRYSRRTQLLVEIFGTIFSSCLSASSRFTSPGPSWKQRSPAARLPTIPGARSLAGVGADTHRLRPACIAGHLRTHQAHRNSSRAHTGHGRH